MKLLRKFAVFIQKLEVVSDTIASVLLGKKKTDVKRETTFLEFLKSFIFLPFRHVELENIEIKRKSNQDESTKDDEAFVGNAKRPRISFP